MNKCQNKLRTALLLLIVFVLAIAIKFPGVSLVVSAETPEASQDLLSSDEHEGNQESEVDVQIVSETPVQPIEADSLELDLNEESHINNMNGTDVQVNLSEVSNESELFINQDKLVAEVNEELLLSEQPKGDPERIGSQRLTRSRGVTQVWFVRKDGTEVLTDYTDPTQPLGLNGTPAQTGFWIFKEYFVGWSDNPDYKTDGAGHLFYENASVNDVISAGLGAQPKLYALYASPFDLPNVTILTGIRINDSVSADDFVHPGSPVKTGDETVATYNAADGIMISIN